MFTTVWRQQKKKSTLPLGEPRFHGRVIKDCHSQISTELLTFWSVLQLDLVETEGQQTKPGFMNKACSKPTMTQACNSDLVDVLFFTDPPETQIPSQDGTTWRSCLH